MKLCAPYRSEDGVNFRQFMRTLAKFRPIKEHQANQLNSREAKLKCKLAICRCQSVLN